LFHSFSLSLNLLAIGAGYATAKTGVAVLSVCTLRPDILMRAFVPVAMAGIVGLYGIIVAIFLMTRMARDTYSLFMGSTHLGAGLVCGLSSLAAGFAIAVVGEAGVRGFAQQPRLFMGMILVLIFAEVLGIYGVIGAVYLNSKGSTATCVLPNFK
jgi:V-type H+-transporting ATPase proteolipid subunit